MASIRLRFLLPALSLIACGGGGDGGDEGNDPPSGEFYTFVANEVTVPTTNTEARTIGLHITDDDGDDIQNQLGMVLATLTSQGFDIQTTIDETIDDGGIILLYEVQTPDFTNSKGTGFQLHLGANPSPAPCDDPDDPATCGNHLDGNGTFEISPDSPDNDALEGRIINGTFNGGPGNLSLQIALGGGPIQLDLIGARVKATGISEGGVEEVILAGAVSEEALQDTVIPAVHAQLGPLTDEGCGPLADRMPPACGCADNTTGKTVIDVFDANNDCDVSIDEIRNNGLIKSLLAPDVEIDGVEALSIGITTTAVKGTITE